MRHNGTVTKYDRQYGVGYITENESEYYFTHKNIIMDGFRYLEPGDNVTFSIGVKGDSLIATEIKLKV
jgi:cold shock CspA family protein